jgi:ABC-type Mn2+/Zn2+ transport system ATPase subunit
MHFLVVERTQAFSAVVGINGAGKSTLFKILIGEEPACATA